MSESGKCKCGTAWPPVPYLSNSRGRQFRRCKICGFVAWVAKATLILMLVGCGTTREVSAETKRTTRTVLTTVRQQIQPDGKILELTDRSTTITNEMTGETKSESVEVVPPKIVGDIGKILATAGHVGAVAIGGPIAVSLWDSLIPALTGGAAAAATGGVAIHRLIASRRRLETEKGEVEHALEQTCQGIQDAKVDMHAEDVEALREALGKAQDKKVRDKVKAIKDRLPAKRSA